MTSFNNPLLLPAAVGIGLVVTACLGGNQKLVERKTAELCAINEQVVKQAVPDGLKEGESVDIKATVRVERSLDKAPIVRDLKVENVKISTASGVVSNEIAVPIIGAGKIREPNVTEKQSPSGTPGFRQECLNVPATAITPEVHSQTTTEK